MSKQIINSVTKFRQTEETIKQMTEHAINKSVNNLQIEELAGGLCNAVYLIEADGEKMVLKIASDPSVKVMRHEKDYVSIEAKMLHDIGQVSDFSMPHLICFDDSGKICSVPYFFMTFLPGKALSSIEPYPPQKDIYVIQKEMGRITKKINDIKATKFGIPAMPETYTNSNSEFVTTLFQYLLMDAEDKQIDIPGISPQELLSLIGSCRDVLDEVKEPVYAHTDTWNGNIMVENGKFTGLVDFAAILYGDPLISHDFHDFGESPSTAFMEGYGITSLTKNQKKRILIYKIWHCLGIIVERGFREYEDPNQYTWVFDIFKENIKLIRKM